MNGDSALYEEIMEDAAVNPVRELLEDEDTAYLYLVEKWLTDAVAMLRDARRGAGLTQGEVAERLGTKQPAIARLERDHEGRFSLRRFAEFALACGVLPADLCLEAAENLRRRAIGDLDTTQGERDSEEWQTSIADPGGIRSTTDAESSGLYGKYFINAFVTCMLDEPGSGFKIQPSDRELLLDTLQHFSYDEGWGDGAEWSPKASPNSAVLGYSTIRSDRRCARLSGQEVGRNVALGRAS